MDRRDFLKKLGLGAFSFAVLGCDSYGQKDSISKLKDKPNIVLMLSDDLSWHDCGCYGNLDVKTPNIDKLASQGMRFTRAFTATAMCAPTRQQLYTGIYPVRNGAFPNHSKVKPGTKSMVHYFKNLGYRVGLSGKTHFGPAASFPFERLGGGSPTFPKIEEFIKRDTQQPFCLVVTSHNPHGPWIGNKKYDPEKLMLRPYMVDTTETRKALASYYSEVEDFDNELKKCMDAVKKNVAEENTIFIFTSEQGSGMPHAKWTCYDAGLMVAFIVRWPGVVRPGTVTNAMVEYVDVVPTLIEAAGGDPVDGLDGKSFLPVLLGQSDHHKDVVLGVHTTKGIINGTSGGYPVRSIRSEKYKYIMNLNHEATFDNAITLEGQEGSYWNSWKEKAKTDAKAAKIVEMYQHRPAEEFYDIVADPYELNNIADDPANRKTMDKMKKQLQAWMTQQGDKGLATELAVKRKKGGK